MQAVILMPVAVAVCLCLLYFLPQRLLINKRERAGTIDSEQVRLALRVDPAIQEPTREAGHSMLAPAAQVRLPWSTHALPHSRLSCAT